jgi:hypothetical protein
MTDLSPETRALLQLGRAGDDPSDEAIDANRSKLAVKLGAAALGAGALASTAGTAWASGKVIALCATLLVGGAAASVYALGAGPTATTQAPVVVESRQGAPVAVATPPGPAQGALSSQTVAPAAPAPVAAPLVAPLGSSGTRSIQSELELIRSAQKNLHRGDARAALALLSEHARRYPSGALSEERDASRVFALCKLGDVAGARAQAARFLRRSPASPFAERVRASCSSPAR